MMSEKEKGVESAEIGDQEFRIQDIQECKQGKGNAKRQMTHLLDKFVAMISEDDPIPKTEIKNMLQKMKQQHEKTLMEMNRLESAYCQKE